MTNALVSEKRYTVEEYFEFEKNSDILHEYYYGKLLPMAGKSKNANKIAQNFILQWARALQKQGFDTYVHEVKANTKPGGIFRYPDFMVAPISDDSDTHVVFQPVIMAEIASEESWHRDTNVKLREYIALASLRYYIVVDQNEYYVAFGHRERGKWGFDIFTNAEDVLRLPAFGLEISVAEIYERVHF